MIPSELMLRADLSGLTWSCAGVVQTVAPRLCTQSSYQRYAQALLALLVTRLEHCDGQRAKASTRLMLLNKTISLTSRFEVTHTGNSTGSCSGLLYMHWQLVHSQHVDGRQRLQKLFDSVCREGLPSGCRLASALWHSSINITRLTFLGL